MHYRVVLGSCLSGLLSLTAPAFAFQYLVDPGLRENRVGIDTNLVFFLFPLLFFLLAALLVLLLLPFSLLLFPLVLFLPATLFRCPLLGFFGLPVYAFA